MASKNKSYVQRTLDKLFSAKEIKKIKTAEEVENLRAQALNIIAGNESEYLGYVEDQINAIEEKLNSSNTVEVAVTERMKKNTDNLKLIKGIKIGVLTTATVMTASIITVSCGSSHVNELESPIIDDETNELPTQEPVVQEQLATPVEVEVSADELAMKKFVENTVESTVLASNGMLSSGVALIDETLTEEAQKDLIASLSLQYYVVANIDDITPQEYMNFMQAEHGNVIDNDDMIYNFRNANEMFKDQILVSTVDNKIDFATFYKNENDAKLLNDAADFIARLNSAETKSEKQAISKEFYDYTVSVFDEDLSNFKYSNSALATFINAEFSAWCELTKSAGFKKGAYPDDELEARVMTVISKCGKSEGEKAELNLVDETKTSLESLNVIRITETLNDRLEAVKIDYNNIILYDFTSFAQMKEQVVEGINLTLFNELQSYTEKQREEVLNSKPVVHKNDSGVSNGQGGTISKPDMEAHGIDPSSPTAKDDYENAVEQETEDELDDNVITTNDDGVVVDPEQLAAWAQQGAIDANNGTYNNNVPAEYKDAYQAGYDAAMAALAALENSQPEDTTFVDTDDQIVDQTDETDITGFVDPEIPSGTPEQNQVPETPVIPETEIPDIVPDPDYNETTFIPVDPTVADETVIDESIEGFANVVYAPRTIEVSTLSRNAELQELYSLRNQLSMAADEAINYANQVLESVEEQSKTK